MRSYFNVDDDEAVHDVIRYRRFLAVYHKYIALQTGRPTWSLQLNYWRKSPSADILRWYCRQTLFGNAQRVAITGTRFIEPSAVSYIWRHCVLLTNDHTVIPNDQFEYHTIC